MKNKCAIWESGQWARGSLSFRQAYINLHIPVGSGDAGFHSEDGALARLSLAKCSFLFKQEPYKSLQSVSTALCEDIHHRFLVPVLAPCSCSSDLLLKSPLQYVCCLIAPFFYSSACHPMLLCLNTYKAALPITVSSHNTKKGLSVSEEPSLAQQSTTDSRSVWKLFYPSFSSW